jgi:hypothetical protein
VELSLQYQDENPFGSRLQALKAEETNKYCGRPVCAIEMTEL